jgi:hypothetical protein
LSGVLRKTTYLTTVPLTLTASTTDADGEPPPVEHMRDVLEPWDCVRYGLRRSLNASRKKNDRESVEDSEYEDFDEFRDLSQTMTADLGTDIRGSGLSVLTAPMRLVIRNFRSYSLVGDNAPPPTLSLRGPPGTDPPSRICEPTRAPPSIRGYMSLFGGIFW